jgi:hypothetical protein
MGKQWFCPICCLRISAFLIRRYEADLQCSDTRQLLTKERKPGARSDTLEGIRSSASGWYSDFMPDYRYFGGHRRFES